MSLLLRPVLLPAPLLPLLLLFLPAQALCQLLLPPCSHQLLLLLLLCQPQPAPCEPWEAPPRPPERLSCLGGGSYHVSYS